MAKALLHGKWACEGCGSSYGFAEGAENCETRHKKAAKRGKCGNLTTASNFLEALQNAIDGFVDLDNPADVYFAACALYEKANAMHAKHRTNNKAA